MSEFEARPERSRLEALVSQLSIRSPSLSTGAGGRPELETCHWAAMLAGMSRDRYLSRTAEYVLQYCYLHDSYYRRPLERALLAAVASRVLVDRPDLKLSGDEVRQVIRLGLDAHAAGGRVTYEDAQRAGFGQRRWARLRHVYSLAMERVAEAESLLISHLTTSYADSHMDAA